MSTATPPESIEGVQIIGIDCAAQPKGFGLARASIHNGRLEILEATKGEGANNCFDELSAQVQGWITGADTDAPARTLLALDAPLGWPLHLTRALHDHRAGAPLSCPPAESSKVADNRGHYLFRRHTDSFLTDQLQLTRAPQDIGASWIARVARSGLELLGRLGTSATSNPPVPLLWGSERMGRLGAIEVYPRLTLRHLRPRTEKNELSYKGNESKHARARGTIVNDLLAPRLILDTDDLRPKRNRDDTDYDDDLIDAVLCALEGLHFLLGKSVGPEHPDADDWLGARTGGRTAPSLADIKTGEGWIWFHEDLLPPKT